ncbi:hypothetical protein ASPWEDRAFT_36407 [Aspergillus wentii DTO 134E9]|uniref:GPI anchored protein n=1 Tax=Aspergillus wentii DTO 134E9 TaxID=1073089 RepID=A0A1L9RV34_ASPWE|nr:uncharacterized protein ASPWEDRAFT_36407 [Aspergillus wentii DTO 134E9]OJJ38727.1 hypothetical protein ASPWEDRAFT_36407 [Aspergillus wentii DTO 134E9]
MRVTTALAVVLPIAHAANSSSPIDTNPLQPTPIRGVKKMTDDEGEKFFFNYWDFGHEGWSTGDDNLTDSRHDPGMQGRSYPLRSSLALELDPFSLRFRRDFKCPTGTFGCTSINRPDSCCSFGDTCELVQDTGSGDVGCCPQGQVCSGTIGSCQKDYTSCPASLGGGCCIPGYDCVSGGCARVRTITVTLSSTVMVSTTTDTAPLEPSTPLSTRTTTATESTGTFVPPARPTGLSTATTTQKTTTSQTESVCPTGFYACSAVYEGGCCQTGRNCDTTSCPAKSSTTLVSNDITIVAPVQPTATATGKCAGGWFSCAASDGGGCCPTGFACGSSCTAMESGTPTATVVKSQPESAASRQSWETVRKVLGISILGIWWMW